MTAVEYRGQTTVITGASAGLGAEFARQLAARGSDLILVARRADRLDALATELAAAHGIRVTPIPLDLSLPGAGRALAAEVSARALPVTSVINNAGFGTFGPFHREDPERLQAEVAVDIAAVVDISRAFIDQLRQTGNGVLLNVASMAAYLPVPNMAVYAASKAFVLNFTEALWQESLETGLRVMALSPGATATEFFEVIGNDAAAGGTRRDTPEQVVTSALRALDRRNPGPSTIPGRGDRIATALGRMLSRRRGVLLMAGMTRTDR
ncbi:SDR family NAD(P)-dependent oxidoreductase [Nocardia sp. CA-107356]|uniref:SDR family NAD(P)-dependent oxidoreductase n=1 Tax=Nocardia sp. CA-107356 TaxID=3239972 RepID=UPI003D8C902E